MYTQKLELIYEFNKRWKDQINPELTSIKYCQNSTYAFLEIILNDNLQPLNFNLDWISEDENTKGTFDPDADIVDNATLLLKLDSFSLNVCFEGLFTKES